jgi:hypothetical protein
MDLALKFFTLMMNVSTEVVKYENFIMEKNEMVKNIKKLKDPREIEEACIWQFICEIMNSLEI